MDYKRPRGTVDLIDTDAKVFSKVEKILKETAEEFNISEIRTPIFESKDLYIKSVGETSDIVNKEFYDFIDKGGRSLVLRPEGTAGTIRAIVENKLLKTNNFLKVYYVGSMFRYERPQSGRQRQFNQFGIECVGNVTLYDEVDVILLAKTILKKLKINNYKLEINNIGTNESRNKWVDALNVYFDKHKEQLTEDSQNRINVNPLRILDDKVDGSKEFVINAPKIKEFLTEDEKIYFENLKKIMDFTGIEYIENSTLVRGLDYYNGIVFEFMSNSKILKGQSTIIGGGRYNKLIEQTGGPDVIGIGFGLGIERIIISTLEENPDFLDEISFDAIILPLSESSHIHAMKILNDLRKNDLKAIINNQTYKLSTHFKFADKYKSNNIIIIGDEELKNNNVIIKNQIDKTETRIEFDKIVDFLKLESSN